MCSGWLVERVLHEADRDVERNRRARQRDPRIIREVAELCEESGAVDGILKDFLSADDLRTTNSIDSNRKSQDDAQEQACKVLP